MQAASSRQDYIICGPAFDLENVGKHALVWRTLHGVKAADRCFRTSAPAWISYALSLDPDA